MEFVRLVLQFFFICLFSFSFFFNDTPTTEIYTLSLHDALPISIGRRYRRQDEIGTPFCVTVDHQTLEDRTVTQKGVDRKSTRLNSSHVEISYAVFCLKKKKKKKKKH